ncbi:MAG: PD-(D/E)XK nuclease family protein [bacterium]
MAVERIFWGWRRDAVAAAVAQLTADWRGGVLELDRCLAVVPTRQAGRLLREALAVFAHEHNCGVLPPRVVLPERFLETSAAGEPLAAPAEQAAVFIGLLDNGAAAEYPNLFPATGAAPAGPRWAMEVALLLCELRTILGENGLLFRDVPERLARELAAADHWEPLRWADLVRLEERYLQRLREHGRRDPTLAHLAAAEQAPLPDGVNRIIVLAVPDPLPLAVRAWARLAEQVRFKVCIHAPETEAEAFDAWGRPTFAGWGRRVLELDDQQVRLVGQPRDQATGVAALLTPGTALGAVVIGVPDEAVVPHLRRVLAEDGRTVQDPAGEDVSAQAMFHLLRGFCRLATEDAVDAFGDLLRHPDLQLYLQERLSDVSVCQLLQEADQFQNRHLPGTFSEVVDRLAAAGEDAVAYPVLAPVARVLQERVARFDAGQVAESAREWLREIYGGRTLRAGRPEDTAFTAVAGAIEAGLAQLASPVLEGLPARDRLELFLRQMRNVRYYPEPVAGRLELAGWLELAWHPAPQLILTGFNEGCVPSSVVGHPFLPDAARRVLGLLHNDQRFARDAFLLAGLLAWRRQAGGAVRIILGKTNDDGDVLRPSRLLFLCRDDQLPGRAARWFASLPASSTAAVAWQRAWTVTPRRVELKEGLRVTDFKPYLACPFRFYLQRVLKMEACDDRKAELDSRDFGNLCHHALEAFANSAARDSADPAEITGFLLAAAEAEMARRYGRQPAAALLIQFASVRQRLSHAAQVQARHRNAGWRIHQAESELAGLTVGGVPVRGRIDRVDRHEADGRLLVLDYKTADTPVQPEDAHLKAERTAAPSSNPSTIEPAWRWLTDAATPQPRRWTDLQLPLYAISLQPAAGGQPVNAAYFNLPKAVTDTAIAVWELSPAVLAGAESCAAGVAAAIQRREFWPPADQVKYDDTFASLFFGTAAESAAPGAFCAAAAAAAAADTLGGRA